MWFSDYGEDRLVDGRARIALDPRFLEVCRIDGAHPFKIFVQIKGDSRGLYVSKGTRGFQVTELGNGRSDAPFSYRVVALRAGYESRRLRAVGAIDLERLTRPLPTTP